MADIRVRDEQDLEHVDVLAGPVRGAGAPIPHWHDQHAVRGAMAGATGESPPIASSSAAVMATTCYRAGRVDTCPGGSCWLTAFRTTPIIA